MPNGSTITYKSTAERFSAETPLGEKFDAKFGGKDYLVEDHPAHTMISVKPLASNMIGQTGNATEKWWEFCA